MLKVRLGVMDGSGRLKPIEPVEIAVDSVIIHPDFDKSTLKHNLALLKLQTSVNIAGNPHISKACLPKLDQNYERIR